MCSSDLSAAGDAATAATAVLAEKAARRKGKGKAAAKAETAAFKALGAAVEKRQDAARAAAAAQEAEMDFNAGLNAEPSGRPCSSLRALDFATTTGVGDTAVALGGAQVTEPLLPVTVPPGRASTITGEATVLIQRSQSWAKAGSCEVCPGCMAVLEGAVVSCVELAAGTSLGAGAADSFHPGCSHFDARLREEVHSVLVPTIKGLVDNMQAHDVAGHEALAARKQRLPHGAIADECLKFASEFTKGALPFELHRTVLLYCGLTARDLFRSRLASTLPANSTISRVFGACSFPETCAVGALRGAEAAGGGGGGAATTADDAAAAASAARGRRRRWGRGPGFCAVTPCSRKTWPWPLPPRQ